MADLELKYGNLSRFLTLLIIINITLFFATGLVQGLRYYFPIIAMGIFLLMEILLTAPFVSLKSKKIFYLNFLLLLVGLYFTISSVAYLIQHGDFKIG